MQTYSIGGLTLGFEGYMDELTAERMKPYEYSTDTPDVQVKCSMHNKPFRCGDSEITYGAGNEYWEICNGHTYGYLFPDETGCFAVKVDFYNNGANADVYLYNLGEHMQRETRHYLFNTLSFMFNHLAIYHNMMVLHSSSLMCNGRGVAFSADSGVGKSTHTGLWLENIPECTYINDDTPLLCIREDKVYISGTPFAGSTGINTNVSVPLSAIVFIKRGETNHINRLDTQTAFGLIMGQSVEPWDRAIFDKLLDTISAVLERVPVYELYCNISPEAAKVAYNGIFNN